MSRDSQKQQDAAFQRNQEHNAQIEEEAHLESTKKQITQQIDDLDRQISKLNKSFSGMIIDNEDRDQKTVHSNTFTQSNEVHVFTEVLFVFRECPDCGRSSGSYGNTCTKCRQPGRKCSGDKAQTLTDGTGHLHCDIISTCSISLRSTEEQCSQYDCKEEADVRNHTAFCYRYNLLSTEYIKQR